MKKLFLLALALLVGLAFAMPAAAQQQQGDKKFEVSGEVRFRGDYSENATDLDDDLDDAGLVWPWRVRAGVHGSFSRNVSGHAEFQAFGTAGDGDNGFFDNNGTSGGNVDLYQGWLELGDIGGGSFDLRMGRQELVYGSEMLLGDNDFYNGVVHDGLRAAWQYKKWALDAWYTKIAETATFGTPEDIFPSGNLNTDSIFFGGYAVFKAAKKIGFDAYMLILNDNTSLEERWTYGGRVYSKWDSNWSWEAELALQTGETSPTVDISAQGFEGELAYQWKKAKVRPKVHGRYSFFTGDDPGTADEDEAFSPLFQDTHARYGHADLFTASDLDVLEVGVSWNGKEDRHVFGADFLTFTLNEDAGGDDDLGTELDLYYNYAYSRNVAITGAIASFSPGDALGLPDDSVLRVYGNTRLRW